MIRTEQACCFTGHRILAVKDQPLLPQKLEDCIRQLIGEGICDFICGGARGFDTLAARTVLALREEFPDIRLILALPCRDQSRRWGASDRALYQEILSHADLVHYTSDHYHTGCMMSRNRFMVDHSAVCVFYLTVTRSGTYKTVAYAMEQERRLCNILSL